MLLRKNADGKEMRVIKGGFTNNEQACGGKDNQYLFKNFAYGVWNKDTQEEESQYVTLAFEGKLKDMILKLDLKKGDQAVVFGEYSESEVEKDGKKYTNKYLAVSEFSLVNSNYDLCHYFKTNSNGTEYTNLMLTGRLAGEAEVRGTTTGKEVMNFTIASNSGKDKTRWTRCNLWKSDLNEGLWNMMLKLQKGVKLYVDGSPRQVSWKAQDGTEKSSEELSVFNVRVVAFPKKKDNGQETVNDFETDFSEFAGTDNIPF